MNEEKSCIWVSTSDVITNYGFDPLFHIEKETARFGRHVRNKLTTIQRKCGHCLSRVWLLDDVVEVSKLLRSENDKRLVAMREKELYSKYTKGLRR